MKTIILIAALAAYTGAVSAAEVTGSWKAEFDTQRGLQKYTFNLKQDGANLTGKASVEMTDQKREAEFKEGKVDGDTVTFVELLNAQGNDLLFDGTNQPKPAFDAVIDVVRKPAGAKQRARHETLQFVTLK